MSSTTVHRRRSDRRRARAARSGTAASAITLAIVLAWTAAGCGPISVGEDAPAAAHAEGTSTPPLAEATASAEDPLSGTWWVLARDLPIRAFRMNLVPAQDPDAPRQGHWISFDWQATTQEERLVRRSKPVAIEARPEGELVVIEGPSPMLTDRGEPNGRRGNWRLELRRTNMPGEPLRLAGKAVHTELTGPEGVSVELSRAFRAWSRG